MSKIETTQSSFLLKYGGALIVFTELLMICTVVVLYMTNGAYIPTFIMLFLSPLLGGILAGKISRKCKKVIFKETFSKYFMILNIILYILLYFLNFRFNIIIAVIYAIGAMIGFFYARKSVEEFKQSMGKDEIFLEGEKISIKEYNLEKFNGETIREFLKKNHLKEENYLLAQMIPTAKEYIIYGVFSFSNYIQYILYFDNEKIYFFELSKFTNKTITNGFFVKFQDLTIKKLRKGLISYKIRIEFKDGSIANMQIPKKVARLFLQKKYGEKLYNKLSELKNKE